MSRADTFLLIAEGFKLGSLGVSKKPKTISYAEEPLSSGGIIGSINSATPLAWTWRESLTDKLREFFSSYFSFQSRKPGDTIYVMLIARAIPVISVYFEEKDETELSGIGKRWLIKEYSHKHIRFLDQEGQKEWKDSLKKQIEESGLLGVHFPEYWRIGK